MNSQRLRDLIKLNSGTLRKFANKNGFPYTTIYQATLMDSRVSNMRVSLFISLAEALGMTVEELVCELQDDKTGEQKGNQ